jgi:hypothetical protein
MRRWLPHGGRRRQWREADLDPITRCRSDRRVSQRRDPDAPALTPLPTTPALIRRAALAVALGALSPVACSDAVTPGDASTDVGAASDAPDAVTPMPRPDVIAPMPPPQDGGFIPPMPPPMPPPQDGGFIPPMPPPQDASVTPMPRPPDAGFIPPMPPPPEDGGF